MTAGLVEKLNGNGSAIISWILGFVCLVHVEDADAARK